MFWKIGPWVGLGLLVVIVVMVIRSNSSNPQQQTYVPPQNGTPAINSPAETHGDGVQMLRVRIPASTEANPWSARVKTAGLAKKVGGHYIGVYEDANKANLAGYPLRNLCSIEFDGGKLTKEICVAFDGNTRKAFYLKDASRLDPANLKCAGLPRDPEGRNIQVPPYSDICFKSELPYETYVTFYWVPYYNS